MNAESRGGPILGMRSLAGMSLVYALGGLAYKGVAVITVPILARLLTPAELGLLDAAAIMAGLIGLAAGLGSEQAVAWLQTRTPDERSLWGSAMTMVGTMGLALLLVTFVFDEPLAQFLTGDARHAGVIVASGVFGAVTGFTAAALNAVRLRGTPLRYAIGSFAVVLAETAVALTIALLVPQPVRPMVFGWAAAAAVVTAVLLVTHLPRLGRPEVALMRRLAAFGLPLVPMVAAWLIGDVAIRSTLAREADLAALGEYGIASRIASVVALVVTGLAVAWQPYVFRTHSLRAPIRTTHQAIYLFLALGGLGAVLIAMSPEVILVAAGAEYANAYRAVAPLIAGLVAFGAFVLMAGMASTSGSTGRIALAALTGAAAQAVLALPLIDAFDLTGAGLASLAGYLTAVLVLVVADRNIRGGGVLGPWAAGGAVVTLALIGAVLASTLPIWTRLTVLVVLAAAATLGAVLIRRRHQAAT